ncbi:MAG: MBOAT family protein [Myxococcales bacterium FL481]|nr:MAG: MBOAT family protein [Myxococcales bacterium FL481]
MISLSSDGLSYYAFFGLVLLALGLTRRPFARNGTLLAASWLFYWLWAPRFLGLLLFSTAVDFCCGRALGETDDATRRRLILSSSIVVNLSLLAAFKYLGFFIENTQALLAWWGASVSSDLVDRTLPLGISFFTFQTLGYTVDVYRRRVPAERSFLRFASYVAFFPQLVAGPIERASRLLPQFGRVRKWGDRAIVVGLHTIALGLLQKVVFAGSLGRMVDRVFASPVTNLSPTDVYVTAFAFMAQLYFDLAGYTNVARGSATLLGFDLAHNFRAPFLVTSPGAFWARWHMSVTQWFHDYVYRPLSRGRGALCTPRVATLLCMLATGFWHGAQWTFLAFGAFHGIWLIVDQWQKVRAASRGNPARGATKVGRWLVTMHLLAFSALVFRIPSVVELAEVVDAVFLGEGGGVLSAGQHALGLFGFGLALGVQWVYEKRAGGLVASLAWPLRGTAYAAVVLVYVVFGVSGERGYVYVTF